MKAPHLFDQAKSNRCGQDDTELADLSDPLLHLYDYCEDAHGFSANEVTTGPEPAKPANAGEVKLERVVSGGKAQITVNHEIGEAQHQVSFPTNGVQLP